MSKKILKQESSLLESKEGLSLDRIKKLAVSESVSLQNSLLSERPGSNFIELANWVMLSFKSYLTDASNLEKFIHNRIVIDGLFLQYCEEKDIKISCLYKDSTISWQHENDSEKFFAQGVFKIYSKDFEILHSALFHKSNHNEDEVSFFVIVSHKNYDQYIKLRNDFDKWVLEKDRSNLFVRVFDSEDVPYKKDCSWEDLFLPANIKTEVKSLVENFLSSKEFYLQNKIPWKRGVLLHGAAGCHKAGTPILMFDGSWKPVEEIVIGDLLMGPDSCSRKVLKLARGKENMYKITPLKGFSFEVNENHILHLSIGVNKGLVTNISVKDYLNLSSSVKRSLNLVKSKKLIFTNKNLDIDCVKLGKELSVNQKIDNKYLCASVNDRFSILKGIVESSFEFTLKKGKYKEKLKSLIVSNYIVNDLEKLVLSLGLNFTKKTNVKNKLLKINSCEISITGDILNISNDKGNNCVPVLSVKSTGTQKYYGFTVDKDHLYVMDNYWITHNCGKSSIIKTIISEYNFKPVTFVPGSNAEIMKEAFSYAEQQSPALLYIEDLDSLIMQGMDVSTFLNLLDGISSKNGLLVIATANDIRKFKDNIVKRPSRFDRKIEIPPPDELMSVKYLQKWFGKSLTLAKCKSLAKVATNNKMTYAYLKELYISSMFEAISNNRKFPTLKEIEYTLNRLIKEKNSSGTGTEVNTEKYFQ